MAGCSGGRRPRRDRRHGTEPGHPSARLGPRTPGRDPRVDRRTYSGPTDAGERDRRLSEGSLYLWETAGVRGGPLLDTQTGRFLVLLRSGPGPQRTRRSRRRGKVVNVASSGSRRVPGVGLTRRRFVKTVGAGVALGVAVPALLAPVSNAAPTLPASTRAPAPPRTLVIGLA